MVRQGRPLKPDEWREYWRRVYVKELRRNAVRITVGWLPESADPPLAEVEDLLLTACFNTRKVRQNAKL